MIIFRSHIESALAIAIAAQEKYEREVQNYTRDSAFLATIREAAEAVKNGEELCLKE